MLSAARRRAKKEAIELDLVSGRVEAPPFADGSFDRIIAVTVLCFVRDADRAIAQLVRLLRPGGHVVIGELGRWNLWAATRRIRGWLGSPIWKAARFRTSGDLRFLLERHGLTVTAVRGAVFYPPQGLAALLLARFDPWLGRRTTTGAAFIALSATKPAHDINRQGRYHMTGTSDLVPPILSHKHFGAPSAFTPESLLREARRQKGLANGAVPPVCLLDPDGDLVRRLKAEQRAMPHPAWACYHTELYCFVEAGIEFGIVGCAVGASFAVLIAEELFASGCRLLISMTSAGQLVPLRPPPYIVLIDRALRDDGTSYHYLPPSEFSMVSGSLLGALQGAFDGLEVPVVRGGTWTTDAPFRETAGDIAAMQAKGLLAVEMEAAALYAFATARAKPVLCLAHVTNQMGRVDGDFEKGEADGTVDALAVIVTAARRFREQSADARLDRRS
jgi:uridine phosphorylase/SAM-dependent methyltransferase